MRGSDYRSNSMSSNHSVSGFEEASYTDRSETPFNKSKNIEFTPASAQRNMDESYPGRSISSKSRKAVRPVFAAGLSYEDEAGFSMAITPEYTSLQSSVEVNHLHQANVTAVPELDTKTEEVGSTL
ncbi:unnamed protein product [Dibothriocephalus latus]|uniref:Uncharacterized protein n=1 Tax=Dibothriocephalus latus TaxID=60516 RepID=A0A3P6T3B9_DIBLA|nr:unnamed protein product [Dibothriocephalus latus]